MTKRFLTAYAATTLFTACGDNLWPQGGPLPPAEQLIIVAHPDDDLIFMQPDLTLALARGESVTTVYVTAGDAGRDLDYVRRRQHGLRYAYGDAIAAEAWQCQLVAIAGHNPEVCSNVGGHAQVNLVFLGWPDGGPEGNARQSLRHLWEGRISVGRSVAAAPEAYTQESLLRVLTAIVETTQPRRIATLDALPSHGEDHSDHSLTGAAAVIATARARSAAPIIAYRGYNIANEPVNKGPELYEATSRMMRAYRACTASCGECEVAPCDALDPYHEGLTLRRYATSLRQQAVTARLATAGGCLDRSGDAVVFNDCANASVWSLMDSELRASANPAECVTVDPTDETGRLALAPCDRRPGQWWRLSDDGFLISGSVAPPLEDMRTRHTRCITADQGGVKAAACGDVVGSRWQLQRRWREVGSPIGSPSALADVDGDQRADLCRATDAGISCRKGRGDASFDAEAIWIVANTQLAHTLVIGTLGDSRVACWLTPTQLRCRGGDAIGWEADVIATSLALLDADSDGTSDVCVDTTGEQRCYDAGGTLLLVEPRVLPAGTTVNLNRRGGADQCGAWNGQFACILRGEAPWLSAPTPWSYIDQGRVTWPASLPARWADIDGDGWLDAVTEDGPNLVMAYNNFYGLGPSFATSAPVVAIESMALGDMDGDGSVEACVEGEATMYCEVP